MNDQIYDIAIIGAGAAGYTASVYASRYDLTNIVFGEIMGGQTAEAHHVQNYLPFQSISGFELMSKFKEHAQSYGAPMVFEKVAQVTGTKGDFTITTASGKIYSSRTILLATGLKKRKLNLPGEKELVGKGVTYCATCDAPLYRGKRVAVVGGSDAANTASLYLAELTDTVYQIYRKDKLRGEVAWIKKIQQNPNITVIYNTNVVGIGGTERLTHIELDTPYNGNTQLALDGLFIEIGSEPDLTLVNQLGVTVDESGLIQVGPCQMTNIEGVWAAGDSTNGCNKFHQIVTASAEGAIAAEDIFQTLQKE